MHKIDTVIIKANLENSIRELLTDPEMKKEFLEISRKNDYKKTFEILLDKIQILHMKLFEAEFLIEKLERR